MEYLLDTNVLSDFVRGDARVMQKLRSLSPEALAVSTISVMEVEYGLKLEPRRAEVIRPAIFGILKSVRILPFNRRDARAAAAVRADLRRRGKPIGPYDVLLAGSAIARGLTFVTGNAAEFERVSGLTVENWRGS